MTRHGERGDRTSLRPYWSAVVVLNLALIIAGILFALRSDVAASLAVPIVAAFLVQATVFLVPGFPAARRRMERRFSSRELAGLLTAASLAPYLIYSIPTGVFSWRSLLFLAAYCSAVAWAFVPSPAPRDRLCWRDGLVLTLLALPMVSGATTLFRDIYLSPGGNVQRLDILGKIMLIPLGALVYLSIRRLDRTGFRLAISRVDLWTGIKNYLWFLPIGVPLAMIIGFSHWDPKLLDSWAGPVRLLGSVVGIYATVALSEELYFRGILENLLSGSLRGLVLARLIASLLFGLAHLSPGFPNWRYAVVAAVAGWFYGRAYSENHSVVASAVTHTLVVVTHKFLFPQV